MQSSTKLPDQHDTIVALSSAVGPAARAIVRLSGQRSTAIVGTLCPSFDVTQMQAGRLVAGHLRLPGFHALIPCEVYHFFAPRTYTGQDVVEIHLLSCQPIVTVLIAECLNAGARAAQPGEFTMRAFLAGKLDLTRAEAVLGVIEASDRHELKNALSQLAGGVALSLQELREDLLNLLADVEAGLDFTDEDIHFISTDDLLMRLAKGLAYLTLLQKQIERRALSQRPFRVVFAGKPNAGKSSLFNALIGDEAAMVSTQPGTTRDYLERTINIDGVTVELVDTAGLHETGDGIEADAQSLGRAQAKDADLTLWCIAMDEWNAEPRRLNANEQIVITKADLATPHAAMLGTSAVTGFGINELRQQLANAVRTSGHAAMAPSLSRCGHHIADCIQHLRNAHKLAINQEMPELLALEVRLALETLGEMAGTVYTNDLLDRIFSRFCIGK